MHDILNAYLENGLRVVLHKIPYAKTAACGLWVNQGSKYEIERTSGLSHLTEHLLVNPENRANEAYQKLMREIAIEGVFHNTSTTKESTSFYFAGLKSALKKA